MLAIAYLNEDNKGFTKSNDPWIVECEGMTFFDIEVEVEYLKDYGCKEIAVFQLDGHRELITWDYVLAHMVIS